MQERVESILLVPVEKNGSVLSQRAFIMHIVCIAIYR